MRFAHCAAILRGCVLVLFLTADAVFAQPLIPAPMSPPPNPQPARPVFTRALNNPAQPSFPTLVFDATSKQYNAKPGDRFAPFVFNLTNVWTNEIVITQVHPSCGCTTAKLPPTPWHLPPGGTGQVEAKVNLAGKMGLVTKTLTFYTSVGNRIVMLKVQMPRPGTDLAGMTGPDRKDAISIAAANPQAIFKADCAKCHVDRGARAFGADLYVADCGICHESSHRDSAVPDLHALKVATDLDFWKATITYGKPHTMMPGFAHSQGGPLSDAQIASLAEYLNRTISHNFLPATMTNAAIAPRPLMGSGIYNNEKSGP
jgi:mono/diheme cytochrome c family protein